MGESWNVVRFWRVLSHHVKIPKGNMDYSARGYTGISYRLLYLDMVWELTLDGRESSDSDQEKHYCYIRSYCEGLIEGAVILSHLNWTGNWREKGYCDIGRES